MQLWASASMMYKCPNMLNGMLTGYGSSLYGKWRWQCVKEGTVLLCNSVGLGEVCVLSPPLPSFLATLHLVGGTSHPKPHRGMLGQFCTVAPLYGGHHLTQLAVLYRWQCVKTATVLLHNSGSRDGVGGAVYSPLFSLPSSLSSALGEGPPVPNLIEACAMSVLYLAVVMPAMCWVALCGCVGHQHAWCCRGSCYGIHWTRVMLSLHVATISVRVRRFNCEGLRQLQICL